MRISDCENIRTHLNDDVSTHIVLYDTYLSGNEYNTLSFVMSNRNKACNNLYINVRYAKYEDIISDALKSVIGRLREHSELTLAPPYSISAYNAIENRLEHEFIHEAMEYIKLFRPYNMNIPNDIDNYQIDFWQFT